MKIDFNNVRRMAIQNYSELVKMLNSGIDCGNGKGMIVVAVQEIKDIMENLRSDLIAIGATYDDPPNEDFVCVLKEDEIIPVFDPEPEEETDNG